ncbi:MAG: hypothetical protein WD270_06035 [Acetobacterales bacterium]
MASITIRNIDEGLKRRLRVRAAAQGRSMEEEVRVILRSVLAANSAPRNLAEDIRARFAPLGGIDLETPARGPAREPPRFE